MMTDILIYSEDGDTIIGVYDENVHDVKIPQCVRKIGLRAFENCINLTSIIIPETVEVIDDYAFAGCFSLQSIVIPNTVKILDTKLFLVV